MTEPNGRAAQLWSFSPASLLRSAVVEIPAMKYALGVGGIAAVVAIVLTGWKLPPQSAVIGTLLVLIAMVVLVIFAALSGTRKSSLRPLALSMAWSFLTLTIATAVLFVSCAFFSVPRTLESLLQSGNQRADVGSAVKSAAGLLDTLYEQKTELVYNRLAPSVRQVIPFAQFRAVTRRQLAQVGSGPIHRTLRGEPKPAGGFLFVPFDAEFDEKTKWLEGVTFVQGDRGWEIYRMDVQPASWSAATGTAHVLTETDPADVLAKRGTGAIDYWLPQQGWHGVVKRVLAKKAERTCDVELASSSTTVNMRNLLGGCTLQSGTAIDIVGKVTAVAAASIDVDDIKYQLAEP